MPESWNFSREPPRRSRSSSRKPRQVEMRVDVDIYVDVGGRKRKSAILRRSRFKERACVARKARKGVGEKEILERERVWRVCRVLVEGAKGGAESEGEGACGTGMAGWGGSRKATGTVPRTSNAMDRDFR